MRKVLTFLCFVMAVLTMTGEARADHFATLNDHLYRVVHADGELVLICDRCSHAPCTCDQPGEVLENRSIEYWGRKFTCVKIGGLWCLVCNQCKSDPCVCAGYDAWFAEYCRENRPLIGQWLFGRNGDQHEVFRLDVAPVYVTEFRSNRYDGKSKQLVAIVTQLPKENPIYELMRRGKAKSIEAAQQFQMVEYHRRDPSKFIRSRESAPVHEKSTEKKSDAKSDKKDSPKK